MSPVLFEIADGVARVTLNRPDKLNAFTADMHQDLREALDRVEADEACRALIITGAGRAFCAGQDLRERAVPEGAPPVDIGAALARDLNPLIARLRALPIPVIAAVNGMAAGAGASLALAADLVLAARSAKFAFSFTRIGLGPDGGAGWMLPRLVGPAKAAGLALLGDAVTASEAETWGLIWRVVDGDSLLDEAAATAGRLTVQPKAALAETKRTLHASWGHDHASQLTLEREAQRRLGFSPDYREGVAAFLQKRPPRFGQSAD